MTWQKITFEPTHENNDTDTFGSQLFSKTFEFVAGNQFYDWSIQRTGEGAGVKKNTLPFSPINSDF